MPLDQKYDADFLQFFKDTHEDLIRIAKGFSDDPESVVQDLYVKVFLKRDLIDITKPKSLRGLLHTMIRNQSKDGDRKDESMQRTHEEFRRRIDPNDPTVLEHLELSHLARIRREFVLAEIKKLPTEERLAFEALVLRGMKPEDYARQVRKKPQTVRNQKTRALNKLQKAAKKRNWDILLILMSFLN